MFNRKYYVIIAILILVFSLLSNGCSQEPTQKPSHEHVFNMQTIADEYLKSEATCQSPAVYYYSCSCGEKGEETFEFSTKSTHEYSAKIESAEYLKEEATCHSPAVYYKSCKWCGKKGTEIHTFTGNNCGNHDFSREKATDEYLKSEATKESPAVYYKSCKWCGAKSELTFEYGEKLKDYTEEEKKAYKPISLTLSLYDAENSIYGFTYNTRNKPLKPVIQIQKGNTLTENCQEYTAEYSKYTSYNPDNSTFNYYVVKAEITLEQGATYTYRAYDKQVEVGTENATFTTKNTNATSFTFSHVSDSQTKASDHYAAGTGSFFAQTLSQITNSDFILHTGDVVEYGKYETYWTAILDDNFSYLSKIPVMAVSGNHEARYDGHSGTDETFKHFNYKLPTQSSTANGIFYSFIYGNTKFIMINSEDLSGNALKAEQYTWLQNELANNTCKWTIVAMHNPIYSVGKWGSDPSKNYICLALRNQLQGLFNQYGVDLVLQGHDHAISRTFPINGQGLPQSENLITENGIEYSVSPSGVIYLMNGPAGNQALSPYATNDILYKYAQASYARSWADFEIDNDKITVTIKYFDGNNVNVYYSWGIKK